MDADDEGTPTIVGVWAWASWLTCIGVHFALHVAWTWWRTPAQSQSLDSPRSWSDPGLKYTASSVHPDLRLRRFAMRFEPHAAEQDFLQHHCAGPNRALSWLVLSVSIPLLTIVIVGFVQDYTKVVHMVLTAIAAALALVAYVLSLWHRRKQANVVVSQVACPNAWGSRVFNSGGGGGGPIAPRRSGGGGSGKGSD